jgi:hypothetical protein
VLRAVPAADLISYSSACGVPQNTAQPAQVMMMAWHRAWWRRTGTTPPWWAPATRSGRLLDVRADAYHGCASPAEAMVVRRVTPALAAELAARRADVPDLEGDRPRRATCSAQLVSEYSFRDQPVDPSDVDPLAKVDLDMPSTRPELDLAIEVENTTRVLGRPHVDRRARQAGDVAALWSSSPEELPQPG